MRFIVSLNGGVSLLNCSLRRAILVGRTLSIVSVYLKALLASVLVLLVPVSQVMAQDCQPLAMGEGQTPRPKGVLVSDIEFYSNDVFVEDDQAIWLHYLANSLHINTKKHIVRSLLDFKTGDIVTLNDIAEAERLLRQNDYLRDAVIDLDLDCNNRANGKVVVNTWDNWTLYPKVNFNRSNGVNRYSYGLKDSNLFGLGIHSDFKYFSEEDRTGYGFSVDAPITTFEHTTVNLLAFDNNDGFRYGGGFEKPFYTLNSTDSHFFRSEHRQLDVHVSQNGDEINVFEQNQKEVSLGIGRSEGKIEQWTKRWTLGVTVSELDFSAVTPEIGNTLALPLNRDFTYPWLEFAMIEDDYVVLTDVNFIYNKEDHHIGWKHFLRVGVEANRNNQERDVAGHIAASSSKGYLNDNHLVFLGVDGVMDVGVAEDDFYKLSAKAEYFYNLSSAIKFKFNSQVTHSENNYLDQPISLGGDNDDQNESLGFESSKDVVVRGYPDQYQHGNKRWQMTAEARYYPGVEFYRLFRLAYVSFVDVGRAHGNDGVLLENEQSGILSSVGVGIRIASLRASGKNLIHIDLARPLTTGKDLSGWDIRIGVKNKF